MSYSFTWRHNESVVSPTSTGSTMSILTYDLITEEDVGNYSCSVSNGIQPNGGDSLTITSGGRQRTVGLERIRFCDIYPNCTC